MRKNVAQHAKMTYNGDRGNIIDLVSLKLILPFEAGWCAVGGALPGECPSYEGLQPTTGTVLSTNALVHMSRTTSAKLVGYRLYRYTAENGYSPAEPETVAATKTKSDDWVRACYDMVMDTDFAVPSRIRHTGGFLLLVR